MAEIKSQIKSELITSRKNPLIKAASALRSSAADRKKSGLYLIEGARIVEDAARSGVKITELYYTHRALDKYSKYISRAESVAEKSYEIDEHIVTLLSDTKSSQEVFAVCRAGSNIIGGHLQGKTVVLENIQDPSNMGNILRTAEALGIKSLVLCGDCCDITSPKVLRGSMGAVFRLNFIFSENAKTLTSILKGYRIYASVPADSAKKIYDCAFTETTAMVIGNEGNGISDEMKDLCDELVTIPMGGRAESLNAGVAAAILIWEMTK